MTRTIGNASCYCRCRCGHAQGSHRWRAAGTFECRYCPCDEHWPAEHDATCRSQRQPLSGPHRVVNVSRSRSLARLANLAACALDDALDDLGCRDWQLHAELRDALVRRIVHRADAEGVAVTFQVRHRPDDHDPEER